MKKILIGEDHSNSVARELVFKLINNIGNSKVHFMIEFEPNDYQKFVQDVMANKVNDPNFQPLVDLMNIARSKSNITIIPMDIPWKTLLGGLKNMIKNKKANTSDNLLNMLLEQSWKDTYSVKNAIETFIPRVVKNKDFKSLAELLNTMEIDNIISAFNGDTREELYKKKSMQILRDKYFIGKVKEISQENPEYLIILVGYNHLPALEMAIKTDSNYYSINSPQSKNIDNFIENVLAPNMAEKQVAPSNSAPNSSFHQAQLNSQLSSLKSPSIPPKLSDVTPQSKP